MHIKIESLANLSKSDIVKFGLHISKWHFDSWGKIAGGTQPDFFQEIIFALKQSTATYFVAIDTDSGECVGVISYKQKNLQDDEQLKNKHWGPWFSGLYVRE